MTDNRHPYDADPDPLFAHRLERMLLERLAANDNTDAERPTLMLDIAPPQTTAASPRHRRLLIATSVAAVSVAAVVLAFQFGRKSDSPAAVPPPRQVSFDVAWPDLRELESVQCVETRTSYFSANNLRCFRRWTGEAELTGDIQGTALWTMLGNNGEPADADDSAVLIPATFSSSYIVKATIDGCGSGEFMVVEHLRFDGWESGAFSGTWQVLPGSGRRELADIAGAGIVPGDFPADGTSQSSRSGQLTCG